MKIKIEYRESNKIYPYMNNPRFNDAAVEKVAMSLKEYGWQQPIVVDCDGVIVVGHTRWKAACGLGMKTCPVVVAKDLTPEQVKAYRIADNRTGELADWDVELLEMEFNGLADVEYDIALTGFDMETARPDADGQGNQPGKEIVCPVCGHRWEK